MLSETRYSSGSTPTDRHYTGQREENGLGSLYDFNARFFSPALGRFLSADTIVPSPNDPQQLNRYAYARGNPLKYIDPTGHYIFENEPGDRVPVPGTTKSLPNYFVPVPDAQRLYGVNIPIRESIDTYNGENGHHPTDAEYVCFLFICGPLVATGIALIPEAGALGDLSWKATVACANSPVCAAALMGGGAKAATAATTNAIRYGPMNAGPLPEAIANTFRGATYDAVTLSESTVFYRVYGGTAGEIGTFWTSTPPSGPLQATIDLAIRPEWGNTVSQVARVLVPRGTTIYEGYAASQGALVGGGNQVVIFNVNPAWLIR